MPNEPHDRKSTAELLANWRAAARDTVAAEGAADVAGVALQAAVAAEHAATEVERAAEAALDAVERARTAANGARVAARHAAESAILALEAAKGDKARANHLIEEAAAKEGEARDRFHEGEAERREG